MILRRILLGLLAVVAAVLLVGIVAGVTYFVRQRVILNEDNNAVKRLPQELASAKAAGLPLTMAKFQKPMPLDSQNAAPLYVHLEEALAASPLTEDQKILEQLNFQSTPTSADWAQATQAVHDRSDLLAIVHQAAARPQCVFKRDWNAPNPASIRFPEFATVREAVRFLTAQSLVMAHQGRFTDAVENETLGFAIARHGASDPTAISYLVGMACDAITLAGLRKIVFLSQGSLAVSATARSVIERNWKPRSLSATLKSEIAVEQGTLAYLRRTGPAGVAEINRDLAQKANSIEIQRNWPKLLQINQEYLLRQMSQVIKIADEPFITSYPQLRKIDEDVEDKNNNAHFLSAMLWLVPEQLAEKRAQIQATFNEDRAGYAVLTYRGKTNSLPTRLPGTFTDPFAIRQPLQYRREGNAGFVVYSVGPNGNFDGGKPGVKQNSFETYFRFPFVPVH